MATILRGALRIGLGAAHVGLGVVKAGLGITSVTGKTAKAIIKNDLIIPAALLAIYLSCRYVASRSALETEGMPTSPNLNPSPFAMLTDGKEAALITMLFQKAWGGIATAGSYAGWIASAPVKGIFSIFGLIASTASNAATSICANKFNVLAGAAAADQVIRVIKKVFFRNSSQENMTREEQQALAATIQLLQTNAQRLQALEASVSPTSRQPTAAARR